ncbi:MAG: two-component system sensor histidine kinase NtrB [Candidatus Sumerlaeaceae bacterium]
MQPAELRPLRPRSRRIPPLAALLFAVCVLLVFNLSYWQLFRYLRTSKEADLRKRLESVAMTAVQALKMPDPPSILLQVADRPADEQSQRLADFTDTTDYEELLRRIMRLQVKGGLSQLTLITPQGVVVVDGGRLSSPGEAYVYTIDAAYIEQALETGSATTPLYSPYKDGELFQRSYQRMTADDGRTLGLLQASISPDYLEELSDLRGRMTRLWLVSTLILLGIGISLYRVFRYLVRLERSAMQGARVEAMGALAGGVAHELRNPLAIIRALAEEVVAEQAPDSRSAVNARDIVAETQRLSEMVSHFLSLSRAPQKGEGSTIELNEELERVVVLLRKGAPENVRFETDLLSSKVYVRADERALRQLFLNMLLNARESLRPEGGKVTISLRLRRNAAEIKIADNGTGMKQRDAARAFEPFFTTKQAGTGLGLAICRGIVENLAGEISLHSTDGQGTEVLVTLPTLEHVPETG